MKLEETVRIMVDRKINYQSISNILGIDIEYIGMDFNNRCLNFF